MGKVKFVCIILITIIVLSCTPQSPSMTSSAVFSMLYNDNEDYPFREDWLILKEYRKIKNVEFNVKLGDNSDYEKSIINALESADCPDIILKVWPDTIERFYGTGILLPFSDYEHLMPYFTSYIKENNLEDELDKLRLSNGKYYILPGFQRKLQVQQWIYRKDVFEENSLSIPETYDELFNSLVVLKSKYPDSTPISTLWSGAHLFAMMGAGYGIPAGWNGTKAYNRQKNRWEYAPATDNYREMITFLNRCYEAEILDPEFITQSDEQFYEKMFDGRVLVTVSWITSGFENWNKKLRENGISKGEWAPFHVPESTIGIKAVPAVNAFRKGLVVPAKVLEKPYFEKLISFLDWAVYSEEGMTLTTWGVEDLTFKQTTEGKFFLPEIITPKNANGTINVLNEYGLDMFFNLNENAEFEDYKKPSEIVAFLNDSLLAGETAELKPPLKLDLSSLEVATKVEGKISSFTSDAAIGFITGELDIYNGWNDYILELEKRGYKVIEEIWNEAWLEQ